MASLSFEQMFGRPPAVRVSAPGRVNLLGEHTDYNDGFVLPTAIPQQTRVQMAPSQDGKNHIYAENLNEYQHYAIGQPQPEGFLAYVEGCIALLRERYPALPGVCMHIASDVPIGAGLSSSAALEVAVLRAYRALFALALDDVEIAQIAQAAEINYAHVRVGIMDQMAASLADTGHMLFIDTRSLRRKLLALPVNASVIVIDSGVPRQLATSVYNQRRTECEEAARLLGVTSLRDVNTPEAALRLRRPLAQRAHHVISENNRVLEAAGGVTAERFGALMNASHASLRDDYEVSIGALDVLTEIMQRTPGVFGARLTGAGFGGACVALAETASRQRAAELIMTEYQARGYIGKLVVPPPVATP